MKLFTFTIILLMTYFCQTIVAQDKANLWTNELYRVGQILSFERSKDGVKTAEFSNEPVNNIIYNIYIDEFGAYGRVDLSLIQLILFNQNQSQYWSYNITVGAFVNDEPLETGNVNHHIGVGADFDISNGMIFRENGKSVDFSNATIGLNMRWDLEIGDRFILQNAVTRGWWGSTNARKWDLRSMIGIETINGLYLTAAPNFIMLSSEKTDNNTNVVTKDVSRHLYCTLGISFTFNY